MRGDGPSHPVKAVKILHFQICKALKSKASPSVNKDEVEMTL